MDWDLEAMLCGMFDFDGDGEFDADEEWIAYQIFKDCLEDDPDDDSESEDDFESDDDW